MSTNRLTLILPSDERNRSSCFCSAARDNRHLGSEQRRRHSNGSPASSCQRRHTLKHRHKLTACKKTQNLFLPLNLGSVQFQKHTNEDQRPTNSSNYVYVESWTISEQLGALLNYSVLLFSMLLPEGSGPIPEVLQYRANPWGSRSKLLHLPPVPKISLISMSPDGGRIRY